MTTSQALNFIEQINNLGIMRVVLTGGETLARKDWSTLVDALLAGGHTVGLLSNGWLFNERVLKQLAGYKGSSFYVGVSIDGVAEDHDRIRCMPGSFERAFRGAQELRADGISVSLITTVSRGNYERMPELREQVLHQLMPYAWQVQVTSPFGRAITAEDCAVTPLIYTKMACFVAETKRMAKELGDKTDICPGDCLGYFSSIDPGLRESPFPGCQAGIEVLGIQSNGNVKGCLSIIDDSFVEGNVLTDGLEAIWNNPDAFAFTRRFDPANLKGYCAECDVGELCRGGCTASSVAFHGEPHNAPLCVRAFEVVLAEDEGRATEQPTTETQLH